MTDLDLPAGALAPDDLTPLGCAWSVRLGHSSRGRRALEVYHDRRLLDVVIERALVAEVLRGAARGAAWEPVLAWGLLPADGRPPVVRFGRPGSPGDLRVVADSFWLALGTPGTDRVTVVPSHGAAPERLRVARLL
jgi:hypothetical protein